MVVVRIILNTLPRSGSNYLLLLFARALKVSDVSLYLGDTLALVDCIRPGNLASFLGEDSRVSQNHLAPLRYNIDQLNRHGLKMVLHLRDPRQAIVGWVHHLDRTAQSEYSRSLFRNSGFAPPMGYWRWDYGAKLDWHIDNTYPRFTHWMARWLGMWYYHQLPIIVTRFEDMIADEQAFMKRITDFYDLHWGQLEYRPVDREAVVHFRRGEVDEWRRVMTLEQQSRLDMPQIITDWVGYE